MLRKKLPLLFSSTFDFLLKCNTCLSGHNLSASYSRTHEVRLSNQKTFKHSSPRVNNAISISVSNMQPSGHFTVHSWECGSTQTEKLLKTSQDFWGRLEHYLTALSGKTGFCVLSFWSKTAETLLVGKNHPIKHFSCKEP